MAANPSNQLNTAGLSKVLVTGASGFVGKALCGNLLHRGVRIVTTCRKQPTGPEFERDQFEWIATGDIGPCTDWSPALTGIEVVFHLAARVHVMHENSNNPLAEFRLVNTAGTEHLARSAAASGVKRLVYVSSIKVNGEETHDGEKFSETDATASQDAYAVSKWEAEQALYRVAQETGLEVVIVRPPLVYGPGVKGNFISLLAAIDRGIPLPLAGANNLRSLLYVGNLVDALIACATHHAAAGQTYLVSDGEDVSTAMLVEKIAHALGRKSRTFYFPPDILRAVAAVLGRAEQVDRLFGSLRVSDEKIRSELAWVPPYTLEQGLRATAEWYRNQKLH